MTGIVAHTYPEWWLKLTGQAAHWSTDYSTELQKTYKSAEKEVADLNRKLIVAQLSRQKSEIFIMN